VKQITRICIVLGNRTVKYTTELQKDYLILIFIDL